MRETHARPSVTEHDDDAGGADGPLPRESHPNDPAALAWDDLETEIISLVSRLSTATFDLLVLVGELDARGTWRRHGSLSCAAWLAAACDLELVSAHNQVRVARAMRAYPALHAAMASGDVSYSKARVLVPHLSAEHAPELIELESSTPASRLRIAIAAWSQGNETSDEIDRRHHRERFLSWRTDPDGMVTIVARLAPAQAAAVCTVIDKSVAVEPTPAGVVDRPTLGQQRADALVRVVDRADGLAGAPLVQPEVVIHVGDGANTLVDGTPLTDHAVTRLLPESFISLLLHDSHRRPIDASPRRRFPTRRQQRIIDEIHPECAEPGCSATEFLQYDHIEAYDDGGPTVVDNLQRLCGPHNRAKEQARQAGRSGQTGQKGQAGRAERSGPRTAPPSPSGRPTQPRRADLPDEAA